MAGKGIVGDRFFGKAAHMDAAVTVFAVEALEAIAAELGAAPFDPLLTRRNVHLRGAQLPPLLGHDFAIESRGKLVRFKAGGGAPVRVMDEMLAPGAHKAMRGRGGVRCQVLSERRPAPRTGRAGQPGAARSGPRGRGGGCCARRGWPSPTPNWIPGPMCNACKNRPMTKSQIRRKPA